MTVELNPGTGGAKIRSSLTGSIETQCVKLVHGTDGVYDLVSASNPLHVSGLVSITGSASVVITSLPAISLSGSHSVLLSGPVSLTGSFMDSVNNAIQVNVVAGSAAGTEFNEDTAHTTGDAGNMPLAVRNDALASLVDTDGDYAPLQVDADGALYVHDRNVISTSNSSATPLNLGVAFTGTGEDVSQYSGVTITLDASHDSAANGMTFQFSTDNSNWDDVYTFAYTAADGARRFQFPVTAQYFRIVYTNGGTNQTHFRVQTILHSQNIQTSIHRLSDDTDPDRSVTLVKSAIVAQAAGSGDFITVNATAGGNFKVAVEEFDAPISITGSHSVMTQGVAAHDAAVSGNPVLTGLEARTTNPTAVADGDAVRAMADDMGRQIVQPFGPRDVVTNAHLTSLSASTTQTLLVAGAAGVFRDLVSLILSNRSSSVADVVIYDGLTGGTEKFRFDLAADGGGAVINFTQPFKQATANNGWAIKGTELDVSVTVQAIDTV